VDGQLFRVDVQQHSGLTVAQPIRGTTDNRASAQVISLSARKVLGAFRITIPVKIGDPLLIREVRNLAVLRYIAQAIPPADRWYPIFVRYIGQVADKVKGLGVDPNSIKPSADDPGVPGRGIVGVHCITGKVCEVLYDCFGDFEGFVIRTCSETHRFHSRETGIAEVVLHACRDRITISVCLDRGHHGKIIGLVLRCAESDEESC
jgi:hypothetical protein